jgi:uncharacterized membrane protein
MVWASIVLLLVSGYSMMFLYFGGFAGTGLLHVHVMQGTGILMLLLFLHLFFVPWRRFGQALASEAFPKPPRSLIRSAASSRSISCSAS